MPPNPLENEQTATIAPAFSRQNAPYLSSAKCSCRPTTVTSSFPAENFDNCKRNLPKPIKSNDSFDGYQLWGGGGGASRGRLGSIEGGGSRGFGISSWFSGLGLSGENQTSKLPGLFENSATL